MRYVGVVPFPVDAALLGYAVESSPDGVVIANCQGDILYANRRMSEMSGHATLIGLSVDDLVPLPVASRHAQLRAGYHERPETRQMGTGPDLSMRRADGTLLPVEVSLSPFEHADGKLVVAAVRDVSERLEHMRRIADADEQLALVAERARIGRDLHDVVLQHLYGMGLSLQAMSVGADDAVSGTVEPMIDDIDRMISEVRTIVFTLGTSMHHGNLGSELADVVAQASRVLGFTPVLRIDGAIDTALSDDLQADLVASMREALSNVARHAQATEASIDVRLDQGSVEMVVTDNGAGPPTNHGQSSGGYGLVNMASRAAAHGGTSVLAASQHGSGTTLTWRAPF